MEVFFKTQLQFRRKTYGLEAQHSLYLYFLDKTNNKMTSKATQEYRLSFITLISQLSEIEQKGQEFFDKM